jgi:hypothetical protein
LSYFLDNPLTVREQAAHTALVGGMDPGGIAEMSLTLGALFRQYVATVRFVSLETAARGTRKPLGGSAIGLDFRHFYLRTVSRADPGPAPVGLYLVFLGAISIII